MRNGLRQPWTIAFGLFSLLLLGGYWFGLEHPKLEPYLKGLNTLQHFLIHYSFGVFAGIVASIGWMLVTKRRAPLAALLLLLVFISHFPDIRFIWRRLPHEGWEVVFLLHTVVDNRVALIWLFAAGSLFGWWLYLKLMRDLLIGPRIR